MNIDSLAFDEKEVSSSRPRMQRIFAMPMENVPINFLSRFH